MPSPSVKITPRDWIRPQLSQIGILEHAEVPCGESICNVTPTPWIHQQQTYPYSHHMAGLLNGIPHGHHLLQVFEPVGFERKTFSFYPR